MLGSMLGNRGGPLKPANGHRRPQADASGANAPLRTSATRPEPLSGAKGHDAARAFYLFASACKIVRLRRERVHCEAFRNISRTSAQCKRATVSENHVTSRDRCSSLRSMHL